VAPVSAAGKRRHGFERDAGRRPRVLDRRAGRYPEPPSRDVGWAELVVRLGLQP